MDSPTLQQPLLFISDAHLGGFSETENARIESELIQLINYCQRNGIQLAVLGDLFDYWMEYPNFVPELGKRLLNRFEQYNNEMGPTLFITGNHDNWTRNHLKKRGFYVVHNYFRFQINGQSVLTLHGDGLPDQSYQLKRPPLHRLLRNKHFVKLFQKIFAPKVGIGIMKYFSRLTRKIDWDPNKKMKLNNWAKKHLTQSDISLILCGHDHIPREEHFPFGTFINLGTFYQDRTMALYNNNAISLVCWEANTQTLKQAAVNE
ncbi:MAG: UDP-2,3-diacylglucosamine diphosphatase [Bacteroidota bacterium]